MFRNFNQHVIDVELCHSALLHDTCFTLLKKLDQEWERIVATNWEWDKIMILLFLIVTFACILNIFPHLYIIELFLS